MRRTHTRTHIRFSCYNLAISHVQLDSFGSSFVLLFWSRCGPSNAARYYSVTLWSVSCEPQSNVKGRKEGREEGVRPSPSAPRWFEPAGTCVAFTCKGFSNFHFSYGGLASFKSNLLKRFIYICKKKVSVLICGNSSQC